MKLFQQFGFGELDETGKAFAEELYLKRPSWAVASISVRDASHFAGLVKSVRPKKLIEVGVASGWGSVVIMETLKSAGIDDFEYFGIDISPRFFHDSTYATGQAVEEMMPDTVSQFNLITGKSASQVAKEVGAGIDFGFIDAHHMHPWATLDFLSILPFMAESSWIALHDINLCRIERHKHMNRGPKYLFEGWTGDKVHSIEDPTMAGAIKLEERAESYLDNLLDILYTPWEIAVHDQHLNPMISSINEFYGSTWANKFERACQVGNNLVNKTNNREIEKLSTEVNRLRLVVEKTSRDVLNGIFNSKES